MKTLILYHANCFDGFSGAYAAFKKFGDDATYLKAEQHNEIPRGVDGARVILIDLCFAAERMEELRQRATSVMVLDHHQTNRDIIALDPVWQYSDTDSGCVMAWKYFHPATPVPLLLQYISEGDTWRYSLPDSEVLSRWIHAQSMTFARWDTLVAAFEDPAQLSAITERAQVVHEYFDSLVDMFLRQAKLVEFQGYRVLAVQAPAFVRSELGHRLALTQPPFGIVWRFQDNGIRCSLRGDGSIDVSAIAKKLGSGGHHNAASFFVPATLPLPFTPIHDANIL
jgi:oligoribonuclease NrnB/cAMP/cGMP phosphodiesterase (DHH superfamily)